MEKSKLGTIEVGSHMKGINGDRWFSEENGAVGEYYHRLGSQEQVVLQKVFAEEEEGGML